MVTGDKHTPPLKGVARLGVLLPLTLLIGALVIAIVVHFANFLR